MNEDRSLQAQKLFLVGILVLGLLVIIGLVWAVSLGPEPFSSTSEAGLSFNDDNDPSLGPGDSKVTVRLFSDLQCPACKAAEPGVKHALQAYAGRVRFIWDDFPLVNAHKNARAAANAARCAEEQGKFWEFREQLYSAQDEWAELAAPSETFSSFAGKLGMNKDAFSVCLAKATYDRKVSDDMAEGDANHVDATPTYFINNRRFVGGLTESDWDREISAALDGAAK